MIYDASALVEILLAGPKGPAVRDLLAGDPDPVVSAVNFAETVVVVSRRSRQKWVPPDDFLAVVPVTPSVALEAASLYLELRVNGPATKLSLADCIAAATAGALGTRVVATDPDFRHFPGNLALLVG